MPEQQWPTAHYKGYRIEVRSAAYLPGAKPYEWTFSIYRERGGTTVIDLGVSESEDAAYSDARKWIDENPITGG